MSTLELFHQVKQLPIQEQLQLAEEIWTGFRQQMSTNLLLQSKQQAHSSSATHRVAGLHVGMAWMSDDFDEPLS